jgi:LacI family transcriptional regulator
MPKQRSGSPTIADVARQSGVGVMTVSRVLNGGKLVKPETAARVRATIKRLGYEPNEAARMLKGQAARTIGLIVPDLADPFFSICAHAVQQVAAKHGFMTVLLASEKDSRSEVRELAMMKARNIAGVLIVPSSSACVRPLREFRSRGIAVVMFDRTFPGVDAGEVMVANRRGAEHAVSHLLDHGHRKVLCLGYDRRFNSISERVAGYESVIAQAGLKPMSIVTDQVSEIAPKLLRRLRSQNSPSAIFSLNNVTTKQVLQIVQREGIAIPDDLAIVGFDDFELAPLLSVPLTAVRQPAEELGRSATRLLFEWIQSGGHSYEGAARVLQLPTELVIRRSCGCQPALPFSRELNHLAERSATLAN